MTDGTVKFFNSEKGFGFLEPDDGSGDVFVHISTVECAGLVQLNKADRVSFVEERDEKSGKFKAAQLVLLQPAPGQSAQTTFRRTRSPTEDPMPARRSIGLETGVVKWFKQSKGFGFIIPDVGGDDIFVHANAVRESGLQDLTYGQSVSYDVETNPRSGKSSAINLTILS